MYTQPREGQCTRWFHFTCKRTIAHIDFIEDFKFMCITYPFDMEKQIINKVLYRNYICSFFKATTSFYE
jgi:hypothetical protein